MEVVVIEGNVGQKVEVGDILEFKASSGEKSYYMISHATMDGYYITNLTGSKTKMKFYETIDRLMSHQRNINRIYSKKEYRLAIEKMMEE
jgi:hypothetical protein